MSLISSVVGFGAFGFAARCFQLGLQKRGMFDAPTGHLVATAAFGLFGYGMFEVEKRQEYLLAGKKERLMEIREKENAAYLAKRQEAST